MALQQYLERTQAYRKSETSSCRLFLAVVRAVRPFKPVKKDTIARWIKTLIYQAGVGDEFKAHSVRGAAASTVNQWTDFRDQKNYNGFPYAHWSLHSGPPVISVQSAL